MITWQHLYYQRIEEINLYVGVRGPDAFNDNRDQEQRTYNYQHYHRIIHYGLYTTLVYLPLQHLL